MVLLLKQTVQMVLLCCLVSLSTGNEELYIQQAVVFIEDAIQVNAKSGLTLISLVKKLKEVNEGIDKKQIDKGLTKDGVVFWVRLDHHAHPP